jgi:hypothetical protein
MDTKKYAHLYDYL